MPDHLWPWIGFNLFVLVMLALDLGVFHRKAHVISFRESLIWTAVWIAMALLFNAGLYYWSGPKPALEFLTGYLIEKSLSVDNIFVFLILFRYFRIPQAHQHKVLFWGILGALVCRAIFIAAGVALIEAFDWTIYIFGVLLVATGLKMAWTKGQEIDPGRNPVLRLFRRFVPVADDDRSGRFIVVRDGRRMATPMLVALVLVELSDVIFAVDSIPAILAITRDPFLVYTSNVFAILGLRSLFFALAGFVTLFHHLHYGLSAILLFVGAKMLLSDVYHVPIGISLGVVAGILVLSVIASLVWPEVKGPEGATADEGAGAAPTVPEPSVQP